ncbi:hypothetical protein SDC9_152769 [bioreactor metagenome]|uniref:Uncharacterized protein n=1 Tax=bioreactor metagenome TaxID=1076179 RepID=A0A645ETZ8_9ZZZZ
MGLKADDIIQRTLPVVLSQLHHGVRLPPGVGVHNADRF